MSAPCAYRYGARDRFLLPLGFAFTVLAWILAYDCTAVVYAQLDQFQKRKTLRIPSDDEPASSVSSPPASGASAESSSSTGNSPASGADISENEKSASSERSKSSEGGRLLLRSSGYRLQASDSVVSNLG
jgi:hypothetical protein